jgi:hypothetical protein
MPTHGYDPEVWLIERVKIFKKYCFPSVVNQSTKDFDWVLYIDFETPNSIKKELIDLFKPYPHFHVLEHVFTDFAINEFIDKDLRKIFNEPFEFIISTRFDTDDMIHKDFIKQIQIRFDESSYQPLNFNNGYIYNAFSGVTSSISYKSNPFMSLIERVVEGSEIKSIFHRMHHEYIDDKNVTSIKTEYPIWCMTINSFNFSTGFFGDPIFRRPSTFAEDFGQSDIITPTFSEILIAKYRFNRRRTIKLMSRFLSIKNLYSKDE